LTLDDSPPPPRKANGNATKPSDPKNRKALSVQARVPPEAEYIENEFTPAAIQVPTPLLKESASLHQPEAKIALASSTSSVRDGEKSSIFSRNLPTEKVERMIIIPPQMPVDNKLREGPTVKFASPLELDISFDNRYNFRKEGVPRPRRDSLEKHIRKKGRLGHAPIPTGRQRSRNMVSEFEIEEDPMDRIVEVGIIFTVCLINDIDQLKHRS